MAWINNDGLRIKFGAEEGQAGAGGEYVTTGPQRMVELTIADMTALGANAAVQEHHVVIPKGARIEKVETITVTAITSGGAAALNVGLVKADRSTELDFDGLIAAAAIATINAAGGSQSLVVGSTGAGALIGTTLAENGILTADYDTAAYTAGKLVIRVYYSFPT